MKFDTIIIGSGLAGMTAAIHLAEGGQKVGVISGGRSTLMFNSGSFGLLGFDADHNEIENPPSSIDSLDKNHPYSRIGSLRFAETTENACKLLERCGLKLVYDDKFKNHKHISPLGILSPAWMTVDGMLTESDMDAMKERKVVVVGIAGFLDFYPRFIAAALRNAGVISDTATIDTDDLKSLRLSETEMRAANIARILKGDALERFVDALKIVAQQTDCDCLIIPAVVDMADGQSVLSLSESVGCKIMFAPTLGVSVPGLSIHTMMTKRMRQLGIKVFNGHKVVSAKFDNDRVTSVKTDKLDDDCLYADNFVFAAGSFFSHGLVAMPDSVVEPALKLDVVQPAERFSADLFAPQPLMKAGVATDDDFKAFKDAKVVSNLYVVGSALADVDSRVEVSGAGVAVTTALVVAENIINN